MSAVLIETAFTTVDCPSCYVVFAVSSEYEARMRATGSGFYCPSGHSMSYGNSDAAMMVGVEDA